MIFSVPIDKSIKKTLRRMRQFAKELSGDEKKAEQFLKDVGLLTKKGNLSSHYYDKQTINKAYYEKRKKEKEAKSERDSISRGIRNEDGISYAKSN